MANPKSMRDLDCIADRIRLNRQRDKRPVVILEGPSDKRVLQRSFHDQHVSYFVAGTRNVALDAATQLADWGKSTSLALWIGILMMWSRKQHQATPRYTRMKTQT